MNIIDFLACFYFLLDLILSKFDTIYGTYIIYYRFFKIMYVLRLWNLIKKLDYMKIIKYVFKNTYSSFCFILLLNVISISIYSILGMQLYKDKFDLTIPSNLERNFNSFEKSFMTVFSIITMDNWDALLIECMKVDKVTSCFFIFSIVFFLGFMMFNLLTTVLLHGFEALYQGDLKTVGGRLKDEYNLFKVKQILLKYNSLDERFSNFPQSSMDNEIENFNFFGSKRSTRQTQTGVVSSDKCIKLSTKERISKFFFDQIKKQKKSYLQDFDLTSRNSYFIFNETNKIRLICRRLNKMKIFHQVIYTNLLVSVFFFCVETFLDYSSVTDEITLKLICHNITIITYSIFVLDTFIKSIDQGLILREKSYLRNSANIIDFLSIIGFFGELIHHSMVKDTYLRITGWSFFRILRTINITYQNEKMKLLLKAIFKSLHGLFSVTLIVLTVWY